MEFLLWLVLVVVGSWFFTIRRVQKARAAIEEGYSEGYIRSKFAESMIVGHIGIGTVAAVLIINPQFVLTVAFGAGVLVGAYYAYRYIWSRYVLGEK